MADLEKDELKSRSKKEIPKPSLSNFKPEPELMPMREKVVLSRKDRKAKELLTRDSKRYGINLDIGDNPNFNYGKTINPVVPKDRPDNLTESARNLQSDDPAISGKAFLDIKGKAPQQEVPKLDSKQLMDDARKQRKAKVKDTFAAFLTGYSGNRFDWENSQSEKLQRKRDEQFQEYKNIADNNKKVKEVWDAKNRDELIDFLDKQSKVRDLNEREAAKLAEARFVRDRDYALKQADLAAKIKSGYYNKRTSTGKSNENKYISFEDEITLQEMDELVGGGAGVSGRNLKRLNELSPESRQSMRELANKTSNLRKEMADTKKLWNEAVKDNDKANTPIYEKRFNELDKQLEEYQNNIKSIILGKTPASATEKQTTTQKTPTILGKGSLDNL